jgi:choline-glycine betaine transporter
MAPNSNEGIGDSVDMTDKDKNAAVAGAAGTVAGAAGSVGTVAAAGTVTGLGATGITSGLAAIGGVVGGGMATGLAITVAAPLVIGGAAYGLYKWLRD